jgi:elongation factor P hydroxylase
MNGSFSGVGDDKRSLRCAMITESQYYRACFVQGYYASGCFAIAWPFVVEHENTKLLF